MSQQELDKIDRRIIAVLQRKGRISNLDLAEMIGLSPTPCSRRIKRLEESGVISGYAARINPDALGLGISAIITLRLSSQKPEDIQVFVSAVEDLPEVTECLLVAGNLDYVLRVRVSSVDGLREFILNSLKIIPCVSETSTMVVLDTVKSTETIA